MAEKTFDINSLLREMIGQPCVGLDNPYGSTIRLEIGPLGLRVDDELTARPHGWRHFTIKSPWRLASKQFVLCDWNDREETSESISERIATLVGRSVLDVSATPPDWDLRIRFSGNLELFVFADSDTSREDAWFLLGTDGLAISAGPERSKRGGLSIEALPSTGSGRTDK
jgi:hypothetical protein